MDLLWPGFLVLLGLIPPIVAIYVWMQRRRRVAVRYSSLSLVRAAMPQHSRWRRHFPFVLFMFGFASLVIALVRPVAIMAVPTNQTLIILAMDVSRSMCSTDIEPNRLIAAQEAAIAFIQQQKPGTQIGIVAFSGFAEMIRPPTTDKETLKAAIDGLLTGRRTAIGSGILKSIDVIAEFDKNVAPSVTNTRRGIKPQPVPKGAYVPDVIVLLTDGANNAGPLPVDAAQQAADRGIRVYTIGFGTERGAEFPDCDPRHEGREPFGGGFGGGGSGGGGGGGFRRGIDEVTLKRVADMTGGTYYSAESATELNEVFDNLPTYLIVKHEVLEISVAFTAIGALLAVLAIAFSLLWHPLP